MNKDLLNKIFSIPYLKEDSSLTNFKTISFTVNVDSISNLIEAQIHSEITQSISRELLKMLNDTEDITLIDYIGKSINDGRLYKDIIDLIKANEFKYVITNGQVGSIMQDSNSFHYDISDASVKQIIHPYSIGSVYSSKIFVDPYMSYDDNRLIMFNDLHLNFKDFKKEVNNNSIYQHHGLSNIKIESEFAIKKSDSKVIYIVESKDSDGYLKFKSLIRDKKIDKILGNLS